MKNNVDDEFIISTTRIRQKKGWTMNSKLLIALIKIIFKKSKKQRG
jgi:hypothetical protein